MAKNEIANIDEQIAAQAAALQTVLAQDSAPRISLKDKKFTLPDGQVLGESIKAVILKYGHSNAYYKKAYNPKAIEEPECFAYAELEDEDTMAPSDNANSPQSDLCKDCNHNQFGSRGDGKACKNSYLVKIAIPGDPKIYDLSISPTGLKPWAQSMKALIGKFQHPIKAIATLEFDPNVTYSKVIITTAEPNPNYQADFGLLNAA